MTNWATKKGYADNGGILIGGRVKGFNVHDNYVYKGWGELIQVYAEAGTPSIINNNLLLNNKLDGISIRGTNNLVVSFTNNTVAYVGSNILRVNGYYGAKGPMYISKNIFAVPRMNYTGTIYPNFYIYTENGGGVNDVDNKKLATWDGVPIPGYGYVKVVPNQSPTANAGINEIFNITFTLNGTGVDPDGTIASYKWEQISGPSCAIASPGTAQTSVTNLQMGTYIFKLTVTDNKGATAISTVTKILQ